MSEAAKPRSTHSTRPHSALSSRLIGSTTAGVLELLCFHPVDTVAKRLMNNRSVFAQQPDGVSRLAHLNTVLFRQHASDGVFVKIGSLFPGLGFAALYKVSQRVYKFGGQPYVNDFLSDNWGPVFISSFGDKFGPSMQQATAGSIIGIGEVLLLPLDVMKIKRQTSIQAASVPAGPATNAAAPTLSALYAGTGWTIARNAPGSFALFGGAAVMYYSVFNLRSPHDATFLQQAAASTVGAAASILVSAPLDVIKTRVQAVEFGKALGGMAVLRELLRTEGVSALWKGVVPKLAVVGPKLVFSFTIAQYLIARLSKT